MNAEMASLGGGKGMFSDVSEASSSSVIPVTCKGRAGELTIAARTGVIFTVLEVDGGYCKAWSDIAWRQLGIVILL